MNRTTEEFDVKETRKAYIEDKVDKLNKKAVKLGVEPMVLKYGEKFSITHHQDPYTGAELVVPYVENFVKASLEYTLPIIEGWYVAGRREILDSENGDLKPWTFAAPEENLPNQIHGRDHIECEHCGQNRNRKYSVVLRNTGDRSLKEVGSSCLRDFLGHDPRGALMLAGFDPEVFFMDDDEYDGMGYHVSRVYELHGIIALSSAVIREFGWMSVTNAEEKGLMPTKDIVVRNLLQDTPEELRVTTTDEDQEKATATIQYWADNENDNDYCMICNRMALLDQVPGRLVGFAASMLPSYQNHLNRLKELENDLPSEHQGVRGERLKQIPVECTFYKDFETFYGSNTLYKFIDESGNIYVTFYSGGTWSADRGDKGLLTGTVKDHTEFNGKPETKLNRVVFKWDKKGAN